MGNDCASMSDSSDNEANKTAGNQEVRTLLDMPITTRTIKVNLLNADFSTISEPEKAFNLKIFQFENIHFLNYFLRLRLTKGLTMKLL